MSCTLTFGCDRCPETVVQAPLAGGHPEANVRVCYPEGWGWDDDANALCPECLKREEGREQ